MAATGGDTMNTYEALRIYLDNSDLYGALTKDELNARTKLESTVSAYNVLAPNWSNAPEWAQWYAIDASSYVNGNSPACFYADEPQLNGCEWYSKTGYHIEADDVKLPLGIDWRLCKWQRPETTR